MSGGIQEEMVRVKAESLMADLIEDLIDNSQLWDRGVSRADIVRIAKEVAIELKEDDTEEELI